MTHRAILVAGSVLGGLAVAAGAFGAHALEGLVTPERLEVFKTAVRYQMYHALAMIALALFGQHVASAAIVRAAIAFAAGIVLFSGSLYALVLLDQPWLGAVTPIGGVAFLTGWGLTAWAAWSEAR